MKPKKTKAAASMTPDAAARLVLAGIANAKTADAMAALDAIAGYAEGLKPTERANLFALADMPYPKIGAMIGQAEAAGNEAGAEFTRVAAAVHVIRLAKQSPAPGGKS